MQHLDGHGTGRTSSSAAGVRAARGEAQGRSDGLAGATRVRARGPVQPSSAAPGPGWRRASPCRTVAAAPPRSRSSTRSSRPAAPASRRSVTPRPPRTFERAPTHRARRRLGRAVRYVPGVSGPSPARPTATPRPDRAGTSGKSAGSNVTVASSRVPSAAHRSPVCRLTGSERLARVVVRVHSSAHSADEPAAPTEAHRAGDDTRADVDRCPPAPPAGPAAGRSPRRPRSRRCVAGDRSRPRAAGWPRRGPAPRGARWRLRRAGDALTV